MYSMRARTHTHNQRQEEGEREWYSSASHTAAADPMAQTMRTYALPGRIIANGIEGCHVCSSKTSASS